MAFFFFFPRFPTASAAPSSGSLMDEAAAAVDTALPEPKVSTGSSSAGRGCPAARPAAVPSPGVSAAVSYVPP